MLATDCKEKASGQMKLQGCSTDLVKSFWQSLLRGQVRVALCDLADDELAIGIDLLGLFQMYRVSQSMVEELEAWIKAKIDVENVLSVLAKTGSAPRFRDPIGKCCFEICSLWRRSPVLSSKAILENEDLDIDVKAKLLSVT